MGLSSVLVSSGALDQVLVESWFSVGLSSVLVSSGALDQVLVESWFRPWRGDKSRALLGLGPGEETSPGLGFEYVMGGSQGTGLGPITGISSTGHVCLCILHFISRLWKIGTKMEIERLNRDESSAPEA